MLANMKRCFSLKDVTKRTGSLVRASFESTSSLAEDLGLQLSEAEIESYTKLLNANIQIYEDLHAMPDNLPRVKYPRTSGYEPTLEENKYGAWYCITEIKGASSGKLFGKRIAIKDTVTVAGVPMMIGCELLEGYTPEIDATIITRLLDAGAIIAGKSQCESLTLSGGSHTSDKGPVINPHKASYSAGGSSSGSAVLVATGVVDMAIGCDTGGSIRIPSSFCGVVGMKPTYGLVPCTGVFPLESSLDHVGPITANVRDNALMLEVLAGPDGLDFSQQNLPQSFDYTSNIESGLANLKIGVIREGFTGCEKVVEERVREAISLFSSKGAICKEISIPWHLKGPALAIAIISEGMTRSMMHGYGFGYGHRGLYLPSLSSYMMKVNKNPDQLSSAHKALWLLGEYIYKRYGSKYYGKAHNLSLLLKEAYNAQLRNYDLLVLPTLPIRAKPLPDKTAPIEEGYEKAYEMIANTCQFNLTGHPALTVPCGKYSDLPIGLMFVGKHFEEAKLYAAGHAFENLTKQ